MANRNFASGGKIYSMHVMPVMVDATIAIGAAGAVSSIKGPLVSSVVRVSLGLYQLNLSDNFSRLFIASGSMQSPPAGLSGISSIEIQNAPDASVSALGSASLQIKTLDAAGALADPASGSSVSVVMLLSNSSVIIQGE